MIQAYCPQNWKDYELIDSGNFEKLERFGRYILIRPEPQAVWEKGLNESEWMSIYHAKYVGTSPSTGKWETKPNMPDNWKISYQFQEKKINFNLALTKFKHVGIFPEQAVNWDFILNHHKELYSHPPRIMNLFAYTGGATLAARHLNAEVYHVDSIRQVVNWGSRNAESSNLNDIRWVVEDAMKFARRELKRGKTYNGIILDPPAFGHGPNGESWKLEKNILELVQTVIALLNKDQHFLVFNTYSLSFSSLITENLVLPELKKRGLAPQTYEIGELYIPSTTGQKLPLGVFCRFSSTKL